MGRVVAAIDALRPALDAEAERRATGLQAAHGRVREAARTKGMSTKVTPRLPVDVIGIYLLLPQPGDAR